MSAALISLLLLQAPELETLVRQKRFQEAVAQAPDAEALLAATIAVKDKTLAAGVIDEVARLRGVLKDAATAAEWLVRLARHPPAKTSALTMAGYLYLRAGLPEKAVGVLVRAGSGGVTLTYLGDAYRRAGESGKSFATLTKAAKKKDVPQRYLQDAALALAARLRAARDGRYPTLLETVGLPLKAAIWLKEDAFYAAAEPTRKSLRKRALGLFRKGLGLQSPAVAYWEAAQLVDGDERFEWLVEAVRLGGAADAETHAAPAALLDLARECAQRKRFVASLSLAQRRLRLGDCPAAWEIIESLPPQTRAP